MKRFREKYSCTIFICLVGVAFLNMGFVVAELKTLTLEKDSALIQKFINLGAEEEKESSSKVNLDDLSEISFCERSDLHHDVLYLLAVSRRSHSAADKPRAPYISKFSPPPKFL